MVWRVLADNIMYACEWIHPALPDRVTDRNVSPDGEELTTEQLLGYRQLRQVTAVDCTHDDYVWLVQEFSASEFVVDMQVSPPQETVVIGVEKFSVSLSGSRYLSTFDPGRYNPTFVLP